MMSRLQVRRCPSNTIVGLNVPWPSARCAGTPLVRRGAEEHRADDRAAVFRQMLLPWGVEPFLMPFSDDPETTILDALAYLKRREWCDEGHWLVVITNVLAHDTVIDSLQLRQVA